MRGLDVGSDKNLPDGWNVQSRVKCSTLVILKVASLDQHQQLLGTCQKFILGLHPDLPNQKLVFSKPCQVILLSPEVLESAWLKHYFKNTGRPGFASWLLQLLSCDRS